MEWVTIDDRARAGRSDMKETEKTIRVCQKTACWWTVREFIRNWVIKTSYFLPLNTHFHTQPFHVCASYMPDWVRRHQQGRSGDVFYYQLQCLKMPQPRSSHILSGWDRRRGLTSTGPDGVGPCQPPCYWHMSFQVLGSYSPLHLARLLLLEEPTSPAILYSLSREPLSWGKRICHVQS